VHRGQDFLGGVLGLDEGDQAELAVVVADYEGDGLSRADLWLSRRFFQRGRSLMADPGRKGK
jgi:hypothetical protein